MLFQFCQAWQIAPGLVLFSHKHIEKETALSDSHKYEFEHVKRNDELRNMIPQLARAQKLHHITWCNLKSLDM